MGAYNAYVEEDPNSFWSRTQSDTLMDARGD